MRRFTQKIVPILVLSVLMLSLSACHGSTSLDPFEMPEEFDTSKNYEITFWAKNDTNKIQTAIYKQAIDGFCKLYPNVTVNMRLYNDYNKIYNDVITNIATGTTPNVCITYPDHISTYMSGENTVVPIGDFFRHEKYGLSGSGILFDAPSKDEIIPKYLSECIIDGKYYALPFMRSTEACYINKTYLERMGYELPDVLTWDFIWEVAEKAAEKDGDGNYIVNGQKVMLPFIYKSTDNMMIQWLFQNKAGYSTADGDILVFNDTARELLEQVALHTQNGAFSTFQISSYPGNFFNAGQCIFAIDSTAGASWLGTNAPLYDISKENIVQFETAVMPIPQADVEAPKMISQGPSVCVFNKRDPQEVLASWMFVQYLLTNEIQIAYSATEGYVPVTSKAQNSSEYKEYLSRIGEDNDTYYEVKINASKMLLENIDNTFVTPVFNGSVSLRNASGQMIESTANAILRKKTVDDAFYEKLYSDMISLYRLDGSGKTTTLSGKKEFGELPIEAKCLLFALSAAWCGIAIYVISGKIKQKKARRN